MMTPRATVMIVYVLNLHQVIEFFQRQGMGVGCAIGRVGVGRVGQGEVEPQAEDVDAVELVEEGYAYYCAVLRPLRWSGRG